MTPCPLVKLEIPSFRAAKCIYLSGKHCAPCGGSNVEFVVYPYAMRALQLSARYTEQVRERKKSGAIGK